jgi:hypothetical protein
MQITRITDLMPKDTISRSLILVVIIAAIISLIPIIFKLDDPISTNTAYEELYKLAVTAALGGSIALLFRTWEHGRQRRAAERTLLHEFHHRFITAYNAAKKARRMLRAKSTKGGLKLVHRH